MDNSALSPAKGSLPGTVLGQDRGNNSGQSGAFGPSLHNLPSIAQTLQSTFQGLEITKDS